MPLGQQPSSTHTEVQGRATWPPACRLCSTLEAGSLLQHTSRGAMSRFSPAGNVNAERGLSGALRCFGFRRRFLEHQHQPEDLSLPALGRRPTRGPMPDRAKCTVWCWAGLRPRGRPQEQEGGLRMGERQRLQALSPVGTTGGRPAPLPGQGLRLLLAALFCDALTLAVNFPEEKPTRRPCDLLV